LSGRKYTAVSQFLHALFSRTSVQFIEEEKETPTMRNPWMKKNPLLSIWLNEAMPITGLSPGCVKTAGERQTTILTRSTQEMSELWMSALNAPRTRKNKRRRMQ
jgi:hypothetical protein